MRTVGEYYGMWWSYKTIQRLFSASIFVCVCTGVCAAHVSRCLWRAAHLINDQHPVLLWHSWMSVPPTERKWMNMNVPEVNGIQSNQCICQKPRLLPQNYSPLLIKPPDKQTQERSSAHKNWWRTISSTFICPWFCSCLLFYLNNITVYKFGKLIF